MKKLITFFTLLLIISACQKKEAKELKADGAVDMPANTMSPSDAMYKKLEGKWQSADDNKNVIEFAGTKLLNYYDGKQVGAEDMKVHQPCEGPCASQGYNVGSAACFLAMSKDAINCYVVVKVNADSLQYALLGGKGNTLTFTKVK